MHNPNYIILWEPEPMIKPEYRLYYDDSGRVLFYSCEKPEGNYIVIDAVTYSAGNPGLRIVDGRISTVQRGNVVARLVPGEIGISCAKEDVSIVVGKKHKEIIKWKLMLYEL